MSTLMMSNEKLLNKATGRLMRLVITTPDNYWSAMYRTNLDFLQAYMWHGSENEKTIARMACYFIIDHADKLVSSFDKQRFAVIVKNILLGMRIEA